jgi:hypothetical protein
MAVAGVVIGIVAVIVTVVIYLFERRGRKSQDEVLAAQLEEFQDQRRERRRTSLAAAPQSRTKNRYSFRVTNNGPGVIRDGRLWLADESGQVSETAEIPRQLASGQYEPLIDIRVDPDLRVRGALALHGRWLDDDGEREELLVAAVSPFESHARQ